MAFVKPSELQALREQPNVIVVGAGAVGIVAAIELARRGRAVLVIEGGPATVPMDWQARNRGSNSGRHHAGIKDGRMQAYGGTTRLWGGQLVPFDPTDFVAEPHLGKPGWPISYQEFAPWVDKAYDFLKVSRDSRDALGLWSRVTGLPPNLGDFIAITLNVWLPQPDFTRLFEKDLAGLPNLKVVANASLRELQFDESGAVSGLLATLADGSNVVLRAPHIILAMGTMETVRQLLVAAKTQPTCGFAENPHLGRWFLDHLHGLCGRIDPKQRALLATMFDNIYFDGRKYNVKMRADQRLRESRRIGNAVAAINAPAGFRAMVSDLVELLRRIANGNGRSVPAAVRQSLTLAAVLLPLAWRYVIRRRSGSVMGREILLGLELEQLPSEKSFIELDSSYPPVDAPIVLHWDVGERELHGAQVMAREVAETFAAGGYGEIEIDRDLLAGDPGWLDKCHDSSHHMGGARMAARARDGVVDPDCRVFGTQNLYIAGAAVFPSGSFANPTLSAIALSLRLAAHVDSLVKQAAVP